MDHYHVWCNLRPGASDVAFCDGVDAYLGRLRTQGQIEGYGISRRKLGLGPSQIGEFHIVIDIVDLSQLERAFEAVSTRAGPIEGLHAAVNSLATDLSFALYRDFPDPHRVRGEEQF
jgi:hypothetical protein